VKVSHPFCDPFNSCRTPGERMKTGCVNFRRHVPQIGYHSNVPWASRRNKNVLLWSDSLIYISWKFDEDQSRQCDGNIGNVRILVICAPTHTWATRSQGLLKQSCQIFNWRRWIIVNVSITIGVEIFTSIPVQTITAVLPLSQAKNWKKYEFAQHYGKRN